MPILPFDAVLFDCDGVLVDSEPITCRVLADMLGELGWPIGLDETMHIFVGKEVRSQAPLILERTGKTLDAEWMTEFRARRNAALESDLVPIPGAPGAVRAIHEGYASRIAVASGADLRKVELQLQKVGLLPFFEGRFFSGHDTPRSKPFPDVYLAAARALNAPPERCAVVEDTVTGATAGVAAGATVFGYSPGGPGHSQSGALLAAGVKAVFHDMAELPALLGAA